MARMIHNQIPPPLSPRGRELALPLVLVELYFFGSFILLILTPQRDELEDPVILTLFVCAANISFAAGYWLAARRYKWITIPDVDWIGMRDLSSLTRLVIVSSTYYCIYSAVMLSVFGISFGQALGAVAHPGSAYADKFQIYDNLPSQVFSVQVLVLFYGLSYFVVPLAVVLWPCLSNPLRSYVCLGVTAFLLFIASGPNPASATSSFLSLQLTGPPSAAVGDGPWGLARGPDVASSPGSSPCRRLSSS